MERGKQPKGKEGQGEPELTTVCWDPALPRCLKRSITGENISFRGFYDEQKPLMIHPQFPLDVLSERSRLQWKTSMWCDSSLW